MLVRNQKGQSTVEFVFVLPYFLLALISVVGLAARIATQQMLLHRVYLENRINAVQNL